MTVSRELEPNESVVSWWQASDGLWYPPSDGKTYGAPRFRYPWEYQDAQGNVLGTVREPGTVVLLSIVTLGIYGLYWLYVTFKELKAYSGQGIGGGWGLFLAFLFGLATAFILPYEVGHLYAKAEESPRTSVTTGFWHLIPIVGWIVWVIKVQHPLNDYWTAYKQSA